jgi:hydroxymethylbilane synthase
LCLLKEMPFENGTVRIATRGSQLARAQAELVRAHLARKMPGRVFELCVLTTTGDRQRDWKLSEQGGKGLFTKELEDALLAGKVFAAVHSAKDLPTELPKGLTLAGFLPRADARDVLVRRTDCKSPRTIASGSPRRREQGALLWPQAKWTELRGNVETRLKKIVEGTADATILAAAGLARLGISSHPGLVFEPVSTADMVPAAGQGAIAVECRAADAALLAPFFDRKTALAVGLERAILAALGGGCHSASAAHYDGKVLHLHLSGRAAFAEPFSATSLADALEKVPGILSRAQL